MIELNATSLLILTLQCAILFVCGSFLFDIVHYVLHVFENSRFPLLRRLGALHGVHHLFLDKQMQIQKEHSFKNIILHILPEYLTAVVGISALGYFYFGWLPAGIVIGIRTVMVVVYVAQRGQDFTHQPLTRINAKRSLWFVGPQYHSLHHVFPLQHYSSFFNIFDMLFGTNCQTQGRKFLICDPSTKFEKHFVEKLSKLGASLDEAQLRELAEDKLAQAEVLILSRDQQTEDTQIIKFIERFKEIGLTRLLPPEVWLLNFDKNSSQLSRRSFSLDQDLTFRYARVSTESGLQARAVLWLFKRGFRSASF